MKNITIISTVNEATRTFVASEDETLRSVLTHDDVKAFFDTDAEEILDSLNSYNGTAVSNDRIAAIFLDAQVEDGDQVEIDLEGEESETDGDGPEDEEGGIATVFSNGGIQQTEIHITPGMTISDAIYSEAVRQRAGMTDAQLSNNKVYVNNEEVPACRLTERKVKNGDEIVLSPRAAHEKGCTR